MKNPPEEYRFTPESRPVGGFSPRFCTTAADGRNGFFFVPFQREFFRCVISDGEGWEHVSVSLRTRCPTWEEMCFIKSVFWDAEECVMQLHPPQSQWVNMHPYCLHLWRPTGAVIPQPPQIFVGIPGLKVIP